MTDGSSWNNLSRIDTNLNFTFNVYEDPWDTRAPPSRESNEPTSGGLPVSPTTRTSFSPNTSKSPPNVLQTTNTRALNESRKLLSHVLMQLANRTKPESIIDSLTSTVHDSTERGFGALAESLREAVKLGSRQENRSDRRSVNTTDHSDDENDSTFTTDDTIELMMQLKDVLTMSLAQGWQIFDDGPENQDFRGEGVRDSRLSSPFRKSRRLSKSPGKRSRSSSPLRGQIYVPELLSLCVSILHSIVSEDCRYRVASPRPSRPPNTLQILTLNVAQFLIYSHRHNPRVISQIAFAVIPAFFTFPPQMHARLLLFFETNVIRTILQHMRQIQGLSFSDEQKVDDRQSSFNGENRDDDPVVSIQIDEVPAEGLPSQSGSKWTPISNSTNEVQSTNNPRQPATIYYLAFLLPPLIGAMLDSLHDPEEMHDSNMEVSSRLTSLLKLIASSKLDTYNDLLEIVAYRGSKARRMAIASLAKLWPSSVGHAVISSPFCVFDELRNSYTHHFVPWHYGRLQKRPRLGNTLHEDCRSCLKPITEYALLCPLCMTTVHFDCYDYPQGNYEVQYSTTDDAPVRIAMYRFSDLQPNIDTSAFVYNPYNHRLKPANWFTLCLCFVCRTPLWGCFAQGLKCEWCAMSLHKNCVSSLDPSRQCGSHTVTLNEMTISWATFRRSCLDYFEVLRLTDEQLNNCSYEEVVIFHDVLQTQMQIIVNGIEFGSIVIAEEDIDTNHGARQLRIFELHQVIQHYHDILTSGNLECSPLTQQYVQDNYLTKSKPSVMFDWSYLEYITATIKTSFPQTRNAIQTASNLLNVDQFTNLSDDDSESIAYPFESTTLAHMRNILAIDFTIRSESAAQFILNQLHHLSFFERVDHNSLPFENIFQERDVKCMFPLPLGLDLSMNVETLVSSVEASLGDLDLSINEFGLLLLTRRFWPNSLASEYGLKRLAIRVISWILGEDDSLAVILREFVAKQKPLPGVRYDRYGQPWPIVSDLRPGVTNIARNGGDYVTARRSLVSRFALPWLFELRNLHPEFYCQTVFDTCSQAVTDQHFADINMLLNSGTAENLSKRCDDILRAIVKLCQFSVIFDVFDDIFIRWMNLVIDSNQVDKPMPSLVRLWGNETDAAQRSTVLVDPTSDPSLALHVDPLRAISNFAREPPSGLPRSLAFLSSVIRSGISIPTTSFRQFLKLTMSDKLNRFENANMLSKAILLSLWQRSSGRQDLQGVISSLHSNLAPKILESLLSVTDSSTPVSIIRRSLAACLRIYGCERSRILAAEMVLSEELQELPSRRKTNVRGSVVADPVFIEQGILDALYLYLQANVNDITSLVAKFLNMFIMESPFLEGFEIDNFILRNAKLLALCTWNVYDIQAADLALVRTNLLLRSLLIDPEHFQEILVNCMDFTTSSIEQRLSGVNRLFRMISDVTSPAFDVEGRQWRSSVIEIFYSFFTALWADPNEEIRIAVRTFSSVLLPVHFEVISQCWNESLVKAPIAERARLVGFLIQLRPHFPAWKVLGWEQIIDTLVEYDYDPNGADVPFTPPADTPLNEKTRETYNLSTTDPDLSHLRVSLVLLSLQMIADGIEIDNFSIMKLKVQFVHIAGFRQVSVIPTPSGQSFQLQFDDITDISESAYPCIEELVRVIDAPHYAKLPYTAIGILNGPDDKTVSILVGSTFLDTSLCILGKLRDLSSLPVLTLKCALETLYIAIHKYDFEDRLFRHLQPLLRGAILRAIGLLSKDISYELRQLSLSIAQASIKRWHTFLGATVASILELVAAEIASQIRNSQDALVLQGKSLIGTTLQSFCQSGLLLSLMRRPLQAEFFTVLSEVFNKQGKDTSLIPQFVCDPLFRDTLSRAIECDPTIFPTILQNISAFVEVVYNESYSPDLLTFTGQHLVHLVRRMSDGTIEGADPSPLMSISVTLMRNNRKHAKDFMPYVDTVVRVVSNRLHVKTPDLLRLIQAAAAYRLKTAESLTGGVDIVGVLFEILLDGFRMKTKVLPLTMKSLIECLTSSGDPANLPPSSTHSHLFRNMSDDAYSFLQNYLWHDESIESDFQAVLATGRFLLSIANQDPSVFQRFIDQSSDKSLRPPMNIRTWNILLLVTLREGNDDWTTMIFSYFSAFSITYSVLLRSYVTSGISTAATATNDVNQVHISMKIWLKLATSVSKLTQGGETTVSGVWNELWPAFEGFLSVVETEAQVGLYPTLTSLTCTSVADILLYVHTMKSSLALDTSSHIIILNRLRSLTRGDSLSGKIARAVRVMSEPPSEILSNIILSDQIGKELVAAEKIRIIESKRDHGRVAGERSRKEGRMPAA